MRNVAVITPIYNTQDYLHKCIQSVLSQKGITLQYILIDDGSTDNSAKIAKYYADRDDRVTLIEKKNEGQGVARNVGIRLADAEFVYFVDSDDSLGENALKILYDTATSNSLDICSPGVPGHYFAKPLEHIACLPCKSQFIRLKIIRDNKIFQPAVSSGQDGVFSHLVLAHCGRVGMNPDAQYFYTHGRDGSTFAKHLARHDLVESIVDQHFSAIEKHYDEHALWAGNSLRLLGFIADETLKNRVLPHIESMDSLTLQRTLKRIKGVIERAMNYIADRDLPLVSPAVLALSQNDVLEDIGDLSRVLSAGRDGIEYKKNENFKKGPVTVCKYSEERFKFEKSIDKDVNKKNLPQPEAKPQEQISNSSTQEIISKLDFVINTINNSTVQLKSALQTGISSLSAGEPSLVASVTTLPSRLPLVHLAIESIFAQIIKPSQVVLWLSDETDRSLIETPELRSLQQRGLDIRFVPDVGPHTKLMYALEAFPDKAIVTFDDDIMYPINMLQSLWVQHRVFPTAIISNWARELAFDKTGKVLGVRSGRLLTPPNLDRDIEQAQRYEPKPTMKGFPYGTSGVLYPPGALNDKVFDVETFRELCPKEDDIWFRAMGILNGTPVVPTNLGINPKHHCIMGSQLEALRHDNHGLQQNTVQMQRVFENLNLYERL